MTQPDPSAPGYPAQPGAQPDYSSQPGYPAQPGYPDQSGYGAQPGATQAFQTSGYPAAPAFGTAQQGWAPAAPKTRAPAPFALISVGLGLLALVLAFFPWISLRVDLGTFGELIPDEDRRLLDSTLDDLYANAWDLRWATRSVLLAVLAALLTAAPLVDRRLRSPWMTAAAVLASAAASVLMGIQIVNRSGIYGRVLEVLSGLTNNDLVSAESGSAQVTLGLRWGAFATAVMVFAQCAVLVVAWLQSRPAGDEPATSAPRP